MRSSAVMLTVLGLVSALACGPEEDGPALELEASGPFEQVEPDLDRDDDGLSLARAGEEGSEWLAAVADEPLVQVTGPESPGYGPPDECPPAEEELEEGAPALDLDAGEDGGALVPESPEQAEPFALASRGLTTAGPGKRPHWGSRTHGDNSCARARHPWWSTTFDNFSIYTWGGCHRTVYYRIRPSIRARGAAWVRAVERAFAAWDKGDLCSPHWVNIDRGPPNAVARVEVEYRGNAGHCSSRSTWYACVTRDRARSRTDQHWWLNLNTAQPYGVGVPGKLDVESLVAVELAHVLYFGHFPSYADSISTANTARWGSTRASMGSADSCNFQPYVASCANCGNRRKPKAGDLALLQHLYSRHSGGCTVLGQRQCGCGGDVTQGRICQANHTWSECGPLAACESHR